MALNFCPNLGYKEKEFSHYMHQWTISRERRDACTVREFYYQWKEEIDALLERSFGNSVLQYIEGAA
jgi:hypothetical protein